MPNASRADPRLVVELRRLQRDVVAEPLRLLVGVGVAADVHQQRAVVHRRSSLVIEPDPLGNPQGDQALPQDVLHRLAEAEIDAQRQRGHDLGEPNRRTLGCGDHQTDATTRRASRPSERRTERRTLVPCRSASEVPIDAPQILNTLRRLELSSNAGCWLSAGRRGRIGRVDTLGGSGANGWQLARQGCGSRRGWQVGRAHGEGRVVGGDGAALVRCRACVRSPWCGPRMVLVPSIP